MNSHRDSRGDAPTTESSIDTETDATVLTAFQQNILVILSEEAMYGLAIKRELEAYYDAEVNHGRLYPNLDSLVEDGLVEKSELDKRTNEYALTAAGEQALFDHLDWIFSKYVPGQPAGADQLHERITAYVGGDES
ncbi:PadR family transcriptional regulator [Halorarum salinum]|uniref:Helix-turn-helix transcriptional regulator n=1 Tax=Halorarum salinum TaxID=2743089 RepID=A0A7D5LC21_9EURY|nr:PadR family transcriptional regulator [Halobaculum salinum]QLG63050.1 helix-turn-helix transcriptional regulator [Halobaculum salinum]